MSHPDDQEYLLRVEQAWVRAHKEMDIEIIANILDDDYTQLKPDGTVIGKEALLSSYGRGARYWEIAQSEPIKIQITGDVGLLFGRWRGKGANRGEAFDYETVFLAVYRKRSGEWKLLADASLSQG